jgi:hypothetical protein
MYLLYVDEAGDSGMVNSPTRYFALSGLVIHELRWRTYLDDLIDFRKQMRQQYTLKLREEFHSAAMITKPGELVRIARHHRLAMIRHFADRMAAMADASIINVLVDKQTKRPDYDVFGMAWRALIQRFENTIRHHNFPGPRNTDDKGLLLCDHTEDKKLRMLLRQMRRFNPIPNQMATFGPGHRDIPLSAIVEDPNFRDSEHSYFIQAVDLAAFLLYQRFTPNAYMKAHGGQNFFTRLKPILCPHASPRDPDGIVRL